MNIDCDAEATIAVLDANRGRRCAIALAGSMLRSFLTKGSCPKYVQATKEKRRVIVGIVSICGFVSVSCGVVRRFDQERAIGAVQAIREAEEAFKSKNGRYGTLDELATTHFGIPSPAQDNYEFRLRATSTSYGAVAVPTRWKEQSLSLYLDQSGIIRGMFKNGAEATDKDPPLRGYGINP